MITNPITGEAFDLNNPEELIEAHRQFKHLQKDMEDYKKKLYKKFDEVLGKKKSIEIGPYELHKQTIKYYDWNEHELKNYLDEDQLSACKKLQTGLVKEMIKLLPPEERDLAANTQNILSRKITKYLIK